MTNVVAKWSDWTPELRSVLRIVAAFMFIPAGTMKLFGVPFAMPGGGTVPLVSELGLAAVLEIVGGGLVLLGWFTRPVAFVLAGEMAVAYFQAFAPHGFWPMATGGIAPALYCFVWLYLSAAGGGPWSVDALLARPRSAP